MANLKLLGAVSGYTELAAASNAVPTTFVLPATDGTAGQVLATNGSGQLQFVNVSGGSDYNLPTASTVTLGGVRVDGTTITINGSGVISSSSYTLPTATASVLGGVKVDGTSITISNGIISVGTISSVGAATLAVNGVQRTATIDTPDNGTPYSIACRDISGNLNAVIFQGTATAANFADLAEKYVADDNYEPGTVLEFGGKFEVTIAEDETRKVAGVVSTNPGFIMNNNLECVVTEGERTALVALQGRVPCKVRGKIRKGDLLVSGGGGFARPTTEPKIGTIIGKALEDFEGEGIIEVVVGRL